MIRYDPYDWYFQKEYRDKLMLDRQLIFQYSAKSRKGFRKQLVQPVMIPPNPIKRHATPGDYYGCFSKYKPYNFTKLKKLRKTKNKTKVQQPQFIVPHPTEYFSPYPKAMSPAFRREKKIRKIYKH